MLSEFKNEPLTDFSKPENRKAMEAALGRVRGEIGRVYPIVIGGKRITTDRTFESINPSRRSEVLARFSKASKQNAEEAISTAWSAFERWRKVSAEERAGLLVRTASMLRDRSGADVQDRRCLLR